ncbi:MAG: SIMPL domain-containing protein [Pyrinomonadaceae bacterium]|nr:SIMPL domain-containing protein [Pyrinomonadaceae bacterium]
MNFKHFLMSLMLVLLCSVLVSGQSLVDSSATISTTGKAELFVEPDFVTFRLEVTKENMDLEIAKRETDKVTEKIREIARKYGLKNNEINTTYISVEQKYRYVQTKDKQILDEDGDPIGEKQFMGYEASNIVVLTLSDLSKFTVLFEELLSSGVTEIDDVDFQTTKLRELKDKARDMAIKAAKEKASAMAGSIGQTIGKAIKISEGSNRSSYTLSGLSANSNITVFDGLPVSANVKTGYSPGVITIDATVSVTFLLK